MMVFRNLAYYRFEVGPDLKDIAFDMLPDWEGSGTWMGDIPMYFVSFVLFVMGCFTFVAPREQVPQHETDEVPQEVLLQKPFVVNILRRYVTMLIMGHTLRFFTYISTSLPGTSAECLDAEHVASTKPKTLVEVFFTRYALEPGNNCGDLLFSGHMLQMITPVLCVEMYGRVCFGYSSFTHRCLMIGLWLCIFAMGVLILARRHHYTQDVVLGFYVTPLLWHFYSRAINPKDLGLDSSLTVTTN